MPSFYDSAALDLTDFAVHLWALNMRFAVYMMLGNMAVRYVLMVMVVGRRLNTAIR